ncbi:hypothetical protein T440DRAFT_475973 [Plenodomus tracheiphilus IPT5]|uniref:Uncharacterized protein n=1 Tax=Plenodomus tracheiphilus IPT5 TaxID=1408161 RepID=A0A6A7BHZ3_9PLEO|nr:hypothetical protein T440DRAFT_475973 [Plenodomus tracheiphilus IPT5]
MADKLLAAMSVESHELVRILLTQLPDFQFQSRTWEESPLVAATSLPGDDMLRTIIAYLESTKSLQSKRSASGLMIGPALRKVLFYNKKLEPLLQYLQNSGDEGAKDKYNSILKYAVRASCAPAVSLIIRNNPGGVKVNNNALYLACKSQKPGQSRSY